MKKVQCSIFGHSFEVSKEITYHVKEYKCKNCHLEMTINEKGELVPLTQKYKQINSVLNNVHNKRLERSQRWLMIEDQ
jgi:hypothetical protein